MRFLHAALSCLGYLSLLLAAGYGVVNMIAVLVWRLPRGYRAAASCPPVTVLKPLCGAEPHLYDDLRSFCLQDYPEFQIIFGVRDPTDPARFIAEQVRRDCSQLDIDIDIVVNPRLHGQNCKVSNLINMLPYAKHELLTIADSDAIVDCRYLREVTAPLMDPNVGLVTCLYHGRPTPGIWSRLGAMYINEWYIPSVLLAWLFGYQGYVSGQTVCLTRDTLRSIGGLEATADHLADDYRLGELVRKSGRRIVMSPYVVTGLHDEPSLHALLRHEIRWMRTLAVLRPRSFRGLFVTFSVPLGLLGYVLAPDGSSPATLTILMTVTVLARLVVHYVHRFGSQSLVADLWLIPVRDVLMCCVWLRSFFTSQVLWRGVKFDVRQDGIMRRL